MKNFKHLLSVFCLVVLVSMLVACKSTSVVPPTTTETTNTKIVQEIIRDTVFTTKKDSSFYKAYLECENGKVVLKKDTKPISVKGENLKPPKVTIKDNILQVDCIAEAQKLFAQWKDKYVLEQSDKITRIPYPVVKKLSWWQNTQMILGDIFLVLILIAISGFVLKLIKY